MKNLSFFLILLLTTFYTHSQPGQWKWIKGDSSLYSAGYYGTQRIPSTSNFPPALYEPSEFTDNNGKFWFYGGATIVGSMQVYNDLWRYDPSTNVWTWMKGTHTFNDTGVFGVQGVSSVNNRPPSLALGVPSWVDHSGNFWIYGGGGANDNCYGDMWRYNPSINEWTWMKGTGTINPVQHSGTKGIPDTANTPGAIKEVSSTWTDANNDLWFFGGGNSDFRNALWRYNIASNTWTWVSGSNISNAPAVWGTQGIEDTANIPSGRFSYSHWTDRYGNFWIYGGYTGTPMGDLWRYNPFTNKWAWMSGRNISYPLEGTYNSQCVSANSNLPMNRFESRSTWTDKDGNFWLWGGGTFCNSGHSCGLTDLWKYCVASNSWIWMNGDSVPNNQGYRSALGVSSALNLPGERNGSIGWIDNNKLYLFGGFDALYTKLYSDLWVFEIDTSCSPCAEYGMLPLARFGLGNDKFCEATCISINNQSLNATSYHWYFPGATPSTDISTNPQNICYYNPGNFDITLIATNNFGSDTITVQNAITVFPQIVFNSIVQSGDTLFSVPGLSSYQWEYNNTAIMGANDYYYIASQSGDYSVSVIDSNGCTAVATLINVIANTTQLKRDDFDFGVKIIDSQIFLEINSVVNLNCSVSLTDVIGKEIFSRTYNLSYGFNSIIIENLNLAKGCYFISLDTNRKLTRKIFVY
jgi:hypothetical protein